MSQPGGCRATRVRSVRDTVVGTYEVEGVRVRHSAYVTAAARVLVTLAGLSLLAPPAAAHGGEAGRRPGTVREAADGLPGFARGFDRPYRGFAPANTVLHHATPEQAGLDPRPVEALTRRLAEWTDPGRGSGYLFPGATALLAHDGEVVARFAVGDAVRYGPTRRQLPPRSRVPARTDTVYDLASLSKLFTSVVAVQQIEAGRLRLDAPVARYLPAFAAHGKGRITVEQLLTHTSGLPPDPRPPLWQVRGGLRAREQAIARVAPQSPPGAAYRYSDLNLLSAQLLVEKVTGRRLDALVREGITGPLGMKDTGYRPPASLRSRIAATGVQHSPPRGLLRGAVHDTNAWAMGGVAGHAGVFSTVDDLAVFAQTLLNGGTYRGHTVLSRHGVRLLAHNYTSRFAGDDHGLGFELNQSWYMGGLTGPRTLGHTGFTGTSLVVDPASRSFAILLTNRVHPDDETPSTNPARRAVATALARSVPVRPPGGGRTWSSEEPAGPPATLTTGPLRGRGRLYVGYRAFVDTGSREGFVAEWSADGGRTWQPVPGTALSGHYRRGWQRVRAPLPAGPYPAGLRLRWLHTGGRPFEGRGVEVTGLRVTDGTRVLFDGDCATAPLTARGWRLLPPPWRLAGTPDTGGGAAFGCPRSGTDRSREG